LARNRHQAYSPGDAAADDARLAGSPAAFAPQKRPYLISRSGCAGMQRYVQTWSGDNRTNWETLRYNTRMGLGMSLSGCITSATTSAVSPAINRMPSCLYAGCRMA
jgi:hypothetical protein